MPEERNREPGLDGRGISLLTPAKGSEVKIVQLGDLYIRPDGEELGRTR